MLLPEGRAELDKVATALIDLDKQIPAEIAWVLRVDGHTDVRPINSPRVQVELGIVVGARDLGGAVPGLARRAAAAAGRRRLRANSSRSTPAKTEEAYKRNRRIELKLTER